MRNRATTLFVLALLSSLPAPPGLSAAETPEADVYRIPSPPEEWAETDLRDVLFTFRAARPPAAVFVSGTFNDWDPDDLRMDGPDSTGLFRARLALPPAEYRYVFVADGNRVLDDRSDRRSEEEEGESSVLIADDRFPKVRLRRGDGLIFGRDLSLSPENVSVVRTAPGRIVVTARAHRGDVTGANLLFRSGGEEAATPMREAGQDDRFVYYRGEMDFPPDTEGRVGIVLIDGDSSRVLTRAGPAASAEDARLLPVNPVDTPLFPLPDWVASGVVYRIVTDRFRNGDARNDPDSPHSSYGGDLDGIRRAIPYLADLGVTILWLSPLAGAESRVEKDPLGWREVDPHFGGSRALQLLVDASREAGIRILVDLAFDHTGSRCPAFRACVEKGKESPFWLWYEWRKWPLPEWFPEGEGPAGYYACRGGAGDLPIVNFDLARPSGSEAAVSRIIDATPNNPVLDEVRASVRFWLAEAGMDGFRLLDAGALPPWVWRIAREEARRTKPDALVIGDPPGIGAEAFSPTRFDAAVNGRFFREPCLAFLARGTIDARAFDERLARGRLAAPLPSVFGSVNALGEDGTERFLAAAGNDERRLLLAMLFGATYVGVPAIDYGDEIGMTGGEDPGAPASFDWKKKETPQATALRDRIRDYLTIRREHPALRTGDFRTLIAEGGVFAFARFETADRMVVLLNAGASPATVLLAPEALPFPAERARDLFAGSELLPSDGAFRIVLEALSGTVLAFPESAPHE